MRRLRGLLLLGALALLAVAVVLPLRGVRTPDGHVCGSAWHAARHEIVSGAGLSASELELGGACKASGKKVLKQAAAAGGGGAAVLLLVAVWPARRRHGPSVIAARR